MTRNQISFFATKADLEAFLRSVESKWQPQFVETGLFDSPKVERVYSLASASSLGVLSAGDHNQGPCYLIAPREVNIGVRSVPQRRGGIKYAVDQEDNPRTIVFRPSGIFNGCCLIDGQMGTISSDVISLELFQSFRKEMHLRFDRVKDFLVGKEAGELLDSGWRLTANEKSPVLYDLRRD
jgi:hypothetical protein